MESTPSLSYLRETDLSLLLLAWKRSLFPLYNDKMADDIKAIQIEIRWKRVVQEESTRKQNAYPWNLPPPQKDEKHPSMRSTYTKRSESTEAESSRSESPEQTLRYGRGKPTNGERRLPSLPRPKPRTDVKRDEKENISPISESIECRKSASHHGPLLTFRKHDSLLSVATPCSTPSPVPQLVQLPLKVSSAYERLLGLSADDQFSDIEELASTSGFLPKPFPDPTLETGVSSRDVRSPEEEEDEEEAEISITLDHFLDGVNRLKGDLRVLQMAASGSKSRTSLRP